MKYSKYTPEENVKIGKKWVEGHTGMSNYDVLRAPHYRSDLTVYAL